MESLVELWKLKASISQGHTFHAGKDILDTSLDAIFATLFGLHKSKSIVYNDLQHLQQNCSQDSLVRNLRKNDTVIQFPRSEYPAVYHAILTLSESLEASITKPFPVFYHWVLRKMQYMRHAREAKESFFKDQIDKAIGRIFKKDNFFPQSGLDHILQREYNIAQSEGRLTSFHGRQVYDEVLTLDSALFI